MQWNLDCLKTKFPRLEDLLHSENVGILALQETKNPPYREIKIRGFNVYRKDRNIHGGGVLLAIDKNIPSTPLIINSNLEIIACTVFFQNHTINICNLYLPETWKISLPGKTLQKFGNMLQSTMTL